MPVANAPRHFRIRAPCSSANIGPGFDVLGMSLSLYLTLNVTVYHEDATQAFEMTYSGEGATEVPLLPEQNLITKIALYVLSANGISQLPQPLRIHVDNPIPLGRGLGSSGAAVVAGVLLGDALGNLKMPYDRLLDYCLMIERHPDNVAAALMGGFVASYLRELDPEVTKGVPESETFLDDVMSKTYPQPPVGIGHYLRLNWTKEIKTVAIVPNFEVATAKARAVLPSTYTRHDVIYNFQRLAVLTTALGRSPPDADLIYNAVQDRVHQPYRATLIPGLPEILSSITPAKFDGLLGIFLSGAGPTILALATGNFDAIAQAAQKIFKENGIDTVHEFPPRCTGNTYCPDDNSRCKDKVAVGGFCELQRDDECAGTNPICLNSTCHVKVAPLGGTCGADTTMYVSYDRDNYAVQQIIIRDNCTAGTYCIDDTCVEAKANGGACEQDRECVSEYCSTGGICVNGPDVFHTIPNWLWGVLGAAVVIFVLLILLILWFLHRYQSKKEHAKMVKFFGDNEEFAKYAMLENDDMPLVEQQQSTGMDSRTSVVYLTTPDYYESSALSTHGRKMPPSFT
ncbi:hypothetical protein BJV82DRAFT_646881 [Fennellomyces sp. T-0311]|nr:hypothetical protein BJV82DRAFT_646881 [Fennellomyces sp. T-0311]